MPEETDCSQSQSLWCTWPGTFCRQEPAQKVLTYMKDKSVCGVFRRVEQMTMFFRATRAGGRGLSGGSHTWLSPRSLKFTSSLISCFTRHFLIPSHSRLCANLLQVFPNVFLCAKTQSKVYNRLLDPRGSCGGGTPKCTCSAQAGDSMAPSWDDNGLLHNNNHSWERNNIRPNYKCNTGQQWHNCA